MNMQNNTNKSEQPEGKEIIEGNKLIAEFMGARLYEAENYYNEIIWWAEYSDETKPPRDVDNIRNASSLEYHSSWDWLMPVVEKIETTQVEGKYFNYYGFGVTVVQDYCSIKCYERNKQDGHIYMTPYGFKPESKIQAVWLAVIEFIKWYNQNIKQ